MKLKQARNRKGMTQRQVADATGIPLGTLRRWEQGVNEPDTESLVLLADLYGVSTDEILGSRFSLTLEYTLRTADEQRLLELYRRCSPTGKVYAMQVVETTAALMPAQE